MLTSQSRVLIVDDEPSIRKALRSTLSALGFEIEEAAGGEQVIRSLRTLRRSSFGHEHAGNGWN
jgi:CheY-like chemotaxis protein